MCDLIYDVISFRVRSCYTVKINVFDTVGRRGVRVLGVTGRFCGR